MGGQSPSKPDKTKQYDARYDENGRPEHGRTQLKKRYVKVVRERAVRPTADRPARLALSNNTAVCALFAPMPGFEKHI